MTTTKNTAILDGLLKDGAFQRNTMASIRRQYTFMKERIEGCKSPVFSQQANDLMAMEAQTTFNIFCANFKYELTAMGLDVVKTEYK